MGSALDELIRSCSGPWRTSAARVAVQHTLRSLSELRRPAGSPLNLVYCDDHLTVLIGWWRPGLRLDPHDHHLPLVAGVFRGSEENTFYRRNSSSGLRVTRVRSLQAGQTLSMGLKGIHAVANTTSKYVGVIQVYGGNLFAMERSEFDPVTMEERPFNAKRAAAEIG
jgi:predicted metal-dependent enzyme (double-stranded beta helix superfamily)